MHKEWSATIASGNSNASFVLSKLPTCYLTRQCTLKHEPIVNYQPFCICSGVVVLAMEVLRFRVTITWSFMVQTLKILTDAYTSRIVRGQSTLKDVIER